MIKRLIEKFKNIFKKEDNNIDKFNKRTSIDVIQMAKDRKDPLYDQMIMAANRRKGNNQKLINSYYPLKPLKILPSHKLAYTELVCPYKVEPNDNVAYSDGILENRIEINFDFERVD